MPEDFLIFFFFLVNVTIKSNFYKNHTNNYFTRGIIMKGKKCKLNGDF